ncbi:MAG: hypothetical protein ABW171_07620 [Steroidobacter sp.]
MIEAYAFLAAFTLQILAMSVICPAWLARYLREQAASIPVERLAQANPGVDIGKIVESYVTRYRLANYALAALGLLLMGWLFSYLQRPAWDDGPVETLAAVYFMAQALPLAVLALIGFNHREALERLLDRKRKALLQRRRLFDFVSPATVSLAVPSYFLFVAYVIYIEQDPFPGFHGYITIAAITLVYVLNAFCIYQQLYGKKLNPLESHAGRVHMIGVTVRALVYSCILCVAFLTLNFTLVRMDMQRWEPFAQSLFFTVCALLSFTGITAPLRRSDPDVLGENPAT